MFQNTINIRCEPQLVTTDKEIDLEEAESYIEQMRFVIRKLQAQINAVENQMHSAKKYNKNKLMEMLKYGEKE